MAGNTETGVQFALGGEFGATLPSLIPRALETLPFLSRFSPLVVFSSVAQTPQGEVQVRVNAERKEVEAQVFSDWPVFAEYCNQVRARGMVIVVPSLEMVDHHLFQGFMHFFQNLREKSRPENYRIWFVDQQVFGLPVKPKQGNQQELLEKTKKQLEDFGLHSVLYHHPSGQEISYFSARPAKKRHVEARNYTENGIISFLRGWQEMVITYRGGTIVSEKEQQDLLKVSTFLRAQIAARDSRGILSRETCGCLVYTSISGEIENLWSCHSENGVCFRDLPSRDVYKSGKPKKPFKMGKRINCGSCGDCGGKLTGIAYWTDVGEFDSQRGLPVSWEISCNGPVSHSLKERTWVDPARIQNPEYLFYVTQRKKKNAKAA